LKYIARGQQIDLFPGELIFGRKKLSMELSISEQNVRTCLHHLEVWGNITIRPTKRFSILKVNNWDAYQDTESTVNQQPNQEVTNNQPTSNHKTRSKEVKKKEKETTYSADFETFWHEYPKKTGKDAAFSAWEKRNGSRPPIESIVSKIQELKQTDQWRKDNGQFIPLPTTWINQGRWNDECNIEIKSNKPKGYSMEELHAIADAGRKPRVL
jgi:biotin operon repressor